MAGIQLGLIGSLYGAVGDFESIATVSVGGGGQSSATFTSIPATYTHLQIRGIARDDRAVVYADNVYFTFNGDTTLTNYSGFHYLQGDGASATAGYIAPTSPPFQKALGAGALGASATANAFNISILDILDYTNTNKYKVSRLLSGADTNNTNGSVVFSSSLWMSTAAITSINLFPQTGANFTQYSTFALYGIKG